MIPQTVAAAIGFLVFLAPGLVYELRRERHFSSRSGSAFREASRVALTSVTLSAASLALLVAARIATVRLGEVDSRIGWLRYALPDPERWYTQGSEYLRDHHLGVVGASVALEVLIACGLAGLIENRLHGKLPARQVDDPVTWTVVNRTPGVGPADQAHATIRLTDGTVFSGALAAIDNETDEGEQYVALAAPVEIFRPGEIQSKLGLGDSRLVLPRSLIAEMWFTWVKGAKK